MGDPTAGKLEKEKKPGDSEKVHGDSEPGEGRKKTTLAS